MNYTTDCTGTDDARTVKHHNPPSTKHCYILGMRVDVTSYPDATQQVMTWAKASESRYVCAANVHMVMESYDKAEFARVVNQADLVTPDGKPLVQALRALGMRTASQVRGPSLTLHVCEAAAQQGVPIGLYGGSPDSLAMFEAFLHHRFPGIQVACSVSPPYRSLTPTEDAEYTRQIAESGARVLFVGLGCPKQELWMQAHRGAIPAVMLGVGAAFDFHAGRVKQAPVWMQTLCLEWLFRLVMEPKRLWKRYAKHNPRFVIFFLTQWVRSLFARRWSEAASHK